MHSPPSKPNFACTACVRCICADCLSLAAEYEWLASARQLELTRMKMRVLELEAELALAQAMQCTWKELAQCDHTEVVQMFLDSIVWKRACKPPRLERIQSMRRLEDAIRETLVAQRQGQR